MRWLERQREGEKERKRERNRNRWDRVICSCSDSEQQTPPGIRPIYNKQQHSSACQPEEWKEDGALFKGTVAMRF